MTDDVNEFAERLKDAWRADDLALTAFKKLLPVVGLNAESHVGKTLALFDIIRHDYAHHIDAEGVQAVIATFAKATEALADDAAAEDCADAFYASGIELPDGVVRQ